MHVDTAFMFSAELELKTCHLDVPTSRGHHRILVVRSSEGACFTVQISYLS